LLGFWYDWEEIDWLNMDKNKAKEKIQGLINKYNRVLESNQLKRYTEEETKKDFILPLFEYLGWNIIDKREVSAEETQSSGRVDYGFYLNGRIKFYLEAKSLKTDLHREEYANQAIRYSWNKGVTWAILTDFESIKIFNAENISEYLYNKLYFEIPYLQFIERFDQLWLLSKESFEKDLIDKEAEKIGKKLQRFSVGSTLYKDLNKCREILINDLSQWNKGLDRQLLDEGVQRILDRLIFIRVAEDRGVEQKTLIPLVREWENSKDKNKIPLYTYMVSKFRELDEIYNSNLFSPHPFEKWEEYSNTTENVINILYGKEGYYEYDFKVIPADILGAVYENYLGYIFSQSKKGLTLDKDAKKRKEQGIYYTPSFIVDYIVENALKPVLDNCKTIVDLKKVKVLDPACGSGSFLIKALEVIYKKYIEFGAPKNEFIKLEILTNNIYGVDLDEQAVEIARLNLLINALDSRIKLPSLTNIKNGNSLISGTDEELELYFGKDFRKEKPFNWEEEFPEVFKQGGFDVIIGNPPYVRVDNLDVKDKNYWKKTLKSSQGKYDLYYLFIEKSLMILKEKGKLGFIVPNKFCVAESAKELRNIIFSSSISANFLSVSKIDIFKDASNYPVILSLTKGNSIQKIELGFADSEQQIINNNLTIFELKISDEEYLPDRIIPINAKKEDIDLVIKLIRSKDKFKKYLKVSEGFRIPQSYESEHKEEYKIVKQYQFNRYSPISDGSYISADNLNEIINNNSERFLNSMKEKIIIAEDALQITATLDNENGIPQGGVYFGTLLEDTISIRYLLGLLNSRVLSYVYKVLFSGMHMGGGYLRYRTTFLDYLPVKLGNSQDNNLLVNCVSKIIQQKNDLENSIENSNEWVSIKDEIEKTDKKIDEEVYKLYDLTSEEIKIIEAIANE